MRARILNLFIPLLLFCLPPLSVQAGAGEVMEHLQAIAASPDRSLGTAGEVRTADYVHSVFAALPARLKAVIGRQTFTTPARTFVSASLGINGREIPIQPLWANALAPESTPPEGIRGKIVYAGRGRLEDLDGRVIAGSIVLMDLDSGRKLAARSQPGRPGRCLPGPRRRHRPQIALSRQGRAHPHRFSPFLAAGPFLH